MQTHIARTLHDEHLATLTLLARLETLLGRHAPTAAPEATSPAVAALLRDLGRAVAQEIGPHFAFEETELFPRLVEAGAGEMVALLVAEHVELLALAEELAALAEPARTGGFAPDAWARFHAAGAALTGALAAHVDKEEMGLLPAIDDLLDAETDSALAMILAQQR